MDNYTTEGKFKVGDWVRMVKGPPADRYPKDAALTPDEIEQVFSMNPDANSVLLVVTDVDEPDVYSCTIHPMFPWDDCFLPLGDTTDGFSTLTFMEWELEPYDSDASLDNRSETEVT